jgi:hypothetical protein
MDCGWFDDDTAVLDEFLNVRARVGVPNFSLLAWVEPDFAFSNASNAGGKAFL